MRSYAVIEEGDVWLAISGRLGVTARDPDPAQALAKCVVAEGNWIRGDRFIGPASGRECITLGCILLGLEYESLISKGRFAGVVARRAMLWWLMWYIGNGSDCDFSYPEIAAWCQKKNHSSVIYATKRAEPCASMPEWKELEAAWREAIETRNARRVDREPWCRAILRKLGDRNA